MASEQFDRVLNVATDADRAWEVLTDVERLTGWVGIVHDVVELSRLEKYTAVLQDRVGPFKLRADLDITAHVVTDGREIELQASGRDRAVDSRIAVQARLELADAGDGRTSIRTSGSYQVTGRVASMGGGVIRKKADRILEDFFTNAAKELGGADQQ
jgi:carbon monoxide dehydrogenase subunit G